MSTQTAAYTARVAVLHVDHTWADDKVDGLVSCGDLETITHAAVAEQAQEDWRRANQPQAGDQPVTGVYLMGYDLLDENGQPMADEEIGHDDAVGH